MLDPKAAIAAIRTTLEELWSSSTDLPLSCVNVSPTDLGTSVVRAHASLPGSRWLRVECDRILCKGVVDRIHRGIAAPQLQKLDPECLVAAELAFALAERVGDLVGRPEGWSPTVVAFSPELVLAPLRPLCSAAFEADARPIVVTVLAP